MQTYSCFARQEFHLSENGFRHPTTWTGRASFIDCLGLHFLSWVSAWITGRARCRVSKKQVKIRRGAASTTMAYEVEKISRARQGFQLMRCEIHAPTSAESARRVNRTIT